MNIFVSYLVYVCGVCVCELYVVFWIIIDEDVRIRIYYVFTETLHCIYM